MTLAAPVKKTPNTVVSATPLDRLSAIVAQDMVGVDGLIHDRISSRTALIPELAAHLIAAGGKRLRPVLTLACAQMFGYRGDGHQRLAAAVEFIHTATLLHDDVVDGSALRRGKTAANLIWGNKPTVLVGDYLFARAFQLMVETRSITALGVLSDASAVIVEGEVMQLSTANNLRTTDDEHLAVIRAKTAALFAAATEVSAVISGQDAATCAAMRDYGDRLGVAFQIMDDALDYSGAAANMGKNAGDDFREGKVTLPVMIAYADGDETERAFWRRCIEKRQQEAADFETALAIIARHRGVERAIERARFYVAEARAALQVAPQGPIREALSDLADYVVDRSV